MSDNINQQAPIQGQTQKSLQTYKSICDMDYDTWIDHVQKIHNTVLNITTIPFPMHQDLTRLLAAIDNIKSLLSVFKVVLDNQTVLIEGLYKNVKRSCSEGKNEAERAAKALEKCNVYTISGEMMHRIFLAQPVPMTVNLAELVEKTRAKKVMIDDIYYLLADKMQSVTMQCSVVKDSSEIMRFGKTM